MLLNRLELMTKKKVVRKFGRTSTPFIGPGLQKGVFSLEMCLRWEFQN